ncbi:hypothetical protein VE03_10781, partial [Pseudogymnoascus sp. 23342-1-I1]
MKIVVTGIQSLYKGKFGGRIRETTDKADITITCTFQQTPGQGESLLFDYPQDLLGFLTWLSFRSGKP